MREGGKRERKGKDGKGKGGEGEVEGKERTGVEGNHSSVSCRGDELRASQGSRATGRTPKRGNESG